MRRKLGVGKMSVVLFGLKNPVAREYNYVNLKTFFPRILGLWKNLCGKLMVYHEFCPSDGSFPQGRKPDFPEKNRVKQGDKSCYVANYFRSLFLTFPGKKLCNV